MVAARRDSETMRNTVQLGASGRYAVLVAGGMLSLVSAFVPFYDAGYRLDAGILLAGITPYLLYALPAVLWRSGSSLAIGLAVFAVHAGTVVQARWFEPAGPDGSLIYLVPLLLAAALLPVVGIATRQRWRE